MRDELRIDRHQRQHPETGDRAQRIEEAQRRDLGGRQADFLAAFADRGGDGVGVAGFDAPARES